MRHSFFIFVLMLCCIAGCKGQTYVEQIASFRKQYIKELLEDKRAPIKPSQVKYLQFFDADEHYVVTATFTRTEGSAPFMVPTHSGKQKPFREYGVLAFTLKDTALTLHVYQSVDLVNNAAHKDDLFIPFNDESNYETTYAGGRYIDLTTLDIKDGKVVLDFNKCYNPYCAYADGYSCPVPPDENHLHIWVNAGEKMFLH